MTGQPTMRVRPDGTQEWMLPGGQLHRVGGPAVTCSEGTHEWWINGSQVTEFEHAVVARPTP